MSKFKDIQKARDRIVKYIKRTPLHYSTYFSQRSGHYVYLKMENLQNTGAFKIRGAANYILQINPFTGRKGVITASSGNHGKAVALAASCVTYPAKVVVPVNASLSKVEAIKDYGAEIFYWGNTSKERIDKAKQLSKDEELTFIHSYNHPWIIEGQGTVGLEIIQDLPDVDIVLVPVGGGGLISGIALAIKENNPKVKIYGVEPLGGNSMYFSLQAGKPTELKNINTIADGLRSSQPGDLTFDLVKKYIDNIILVSDAEIKVALKTLLTKEKFLAEPSGVVTLAAFLAGKVPSRNKKVVAVISGGNVDAEIIKKIL